jgi:hypothetical protein
MFNWFKKNKQNAELENLFEIVKNADIVYANYEYDKTIFTFSNFFIFEFNNNYKEKHIKVYDKVNKDEKYQFLTETNPIFYLNTNEKQLLEFKNRFNDKINAYRSNLAIYNDNFNISEINSCLNSERFFRDLAKALKRENLINVRDIAYNLWDNGSYNEDGQTFKEAVLKGLFQEMKNYYGENRLLEQIEEVGSNEQ